MIPDRALELIISEKELSVQRCLENGALECATFWLRLFKEDLEKHKEDLSPEFYKVGKKAYRDYLDDLQIIYLGKEDDTM